MPDLELSGLSAGAEVVKEPGSVSGYAGSRCDGRILPPPKDHP